MARYKSDVVNHEFEEHYQAALTEAKSMSKGQLEKVYAEKAALLAVGGSASGDNPPSVRKHQFGVLVGKYEGRRSALSENGRTAAQNARPEQRAAKEQAMKLFEDWQSGKKIFQSGAAFARHVVEHSNKVLVSPKVVERWVTGWMKKRAEKRKQARG